MDEDERTAGLVLLLLHYGVNREDVQECVEEIQSLFEEESNE